MVEVAVVTGDMRLYYKVVQELKNKSVSFISIKPGEVIPSEIKCVITSSSEKALIQHPNILAVGTEDSIPIMQKLRLFLAGGEPPITIVTIGVDPGITYGLAVLVNEKKLDTYKTFSSENACKIIKNILGAFPTARKIIRIGAGAPLYYKKLLELLNDVDAELELVDEFETSSGTRATKDMKAALAIARKKGLKPQEFEKVQRIKRGTIKHVQKMSRQATQGKITIDEANARKVATGEISLDFAISEQKKKNKRKDA